jgi:N-acetylneuraminic acid mutarotase
MRRIVALLLVLVFLTSSCVIFAKTASSSLDAATDNSWVMKASMNEARAYLGIATVNCKIYAIGGDTGQISGNVIPGTGLNNPVNTSEEYDPTLDVWVSKEPMPTARADFGIAVYQNKIYCIGGYSPYHDTGANEVYNPAMNSWEAKVPLPTARWSAAANVVNGKIYVIGGRTTNDTSLFLNITEVYNPETDSWETKTASPLPVVTPASAVIDNKIYVLGSSPLYWQTFIEVYDPAIDSWAIGDPTPVSPTATAVATTGIIAPKRIYFFDENRNDIYDPSTNNWTVGVPAPTDRLIAKAAVVDDLIYVIGGRTGHEGYITIMFPSGLNEQYVPVGYGTIRPVVSAFSPENKTYNVSSVPLTIAVDKPISWMQHSLDGQDNVTIEGNTTLTNLPNGLHNVTVYAKYTEGSIGASENIVFSIDAPEPFPTTLVLTASGASLAIAGVGLLVYLRKRKH